MGVLKKLQLSLRKETARGYQFAPLRMVFNVKVDLKRKSRIVIGGQVVDLSGNEVYASTMNSVSARILTKIADTNNLEVLKGDIGDAYLNANTKEKIYTHAGTKFDLVDIMDEGDFLEVVKFYTSESEVGSGIAYFQYHIGNLKGQNNNASFVGYQIPCS